MRTGQIASEAVEDAAGAFKFGKALLFFAKLAGMGNHGAAGAAQGVESRVGIAQENIDAALAPPLEPQGS